MATYLRNIADHCHSIAVQLVKLQECLLLQERNAETWKQHYETAIRRIKNLRHEIDKRDQLIRSLQEKEKLSMERETNMALQLVAHQLTAYVRDTQTEELGDIKTIPATSCSTPLIPKSPEAQI